MRKTIDDSLIQRLYATLNREELTQVQNLGWTAPIARRALRVMLRNARKWAPLETCGSLYMGKNGNGRPIALATPCGPQGTHERLTSYQDPDFLNRWYRRIDGPELWFIGQWHTHPFQDEPLPSPWDIWGANLDRQEGFLQWDAAQFEGRGHAEVIMAGRMTRLWWVTTNPDRIRLVTEIPVGIADRRP